MKQFKDFGITTQQKGFKGDKIKIDRIINREIIVQDFKIEDSKYSKNGVSGKCLYLQIELDNTQRVVFTGSSVLMDIIQKINKSDFPFKATIVRENEHFEFR